MSNSDPTNAIFGHTNASGLEGDIRVMKEI
jgi:hypothetical protein